MGADLYVYDEDGNEVAYFRDSYNDSNLLWQVGGSYWQGIIPDNDSASLNYMEQQYAKLNGLATAKELPFPEWADDEEYFYKKLKDLREWLDVAQKDDTTIVWSV